MANSQIPRSQMKDFLNRPYSFNDDLKYNLRLSTGISIGMFIFFLFFQPLDLRNEDLNARLVIIAGFGFITFFILGINLIFLPLLFPKFFQTGKWNIIRDTILHAWIWILISTAYTFYARYVGLIEITAHSMFKILLLGLAPVAIQVALNQNKILKKYLQNALELTKKLDAEDVDITNEEITIESDNISENLTLQLKDIVLVKSANNYIEIFWSGAEGIQKRLIRNTLTKVENQLKKYSHLIRCHRTAIINIDFIEEKRGDSKGLLIKMKGIEELIPVSRQYQLKVKEHLHA